MKDELNKLYEEGLSLIQTEEEIRKSYVDSGLSEPLLTNLLNLSLQFNTATIEVLKIVKKQIEKDNI